MIKTLDSTVLVACDNEITCVNLFEIMTKRYQACIPPEVDAECRSSQRIDEFKKNISIFSNSPEKMEESCKYLYERHNKKLGLGEASALVASILLTQRGVDNYFVTDDRYAREIAEKIHNDEKMKKILGPNIQKIKYTGTIGLILRLRQHGYITKEMTEKIADELERGKSFRYTPELLNLLRS